MAHSSSSLHSTTLGGYSLSNKMLLRTQSNEARSFHSFVDRQQKARELSKQREIKEIHPMVVSPKFAQAAREMGNATNANQG